MTTKIRQRQILLVAIILLLVIKLIPIPNDIQKVHKHIDETNIWSDLCRYVEIAKWFVGIPNNETPVQYQYPPLYTAFIIPSLFMDTITYVLIMNAILSVLTFIPLYLISKRYTGFYESITVSSIVVVFNIIFTVKTVFFPTILAGFLFSWFIYYFMDANQNIKKFYKASILYGLLIFTAYVFFYLLPFIVIWLLSTKNERNSIAKIRKILKFGITPLLFFFSWISRNMYIHGFSLRGAFGGYISLTTETPFATYQTSLLERITSIFNYQEPNTIITYYMIFIVGTVLIWLRQRKHDKWFTKENRHTDLWFRNLLIINFIIFFIFPAMTYPVNYLNWRYLSYLTPVYLALGLVPFIMLIKKGIFQSRM